MYHPEQTNLPFVIVGLAHVTMKHSVHLQYWKNLRYKLLIELFDEYLEEQW